MSTYNIETAVLGLKYQAKQTQNGGTVFVKNAVIGYQLTDSAFNEITDVDYPAYHTYSLSSLTSAGVTATGVTSVTNALEPGMVVTISGASPSIYNGDHTLLGVTAGTTFTYNLGTATAAATGTLVAVGGLSTVPGVVYIDTYIVVQDIEGGIRNSTAGDETEWNALSVTYPEMEPSLAVAIAKSLNYVAAFKSWDTEFFAIDSTSPPPASPLSRIESSYLKLGCATADSVVEFDGGIVFMSKRDNLQRSREIHVLNGLTPKKISDASVERILNGDDLAACYSLYLSTAGHQFYVLTLKTSAITLVYDFNNGYWYQWTLLTAQAAQTLSSLVQASGTATATLTAHGFEDGDPVTIAGSDQAGYNGIQNITYVDANTFTFPVDSATVSPSTGTATAMGYTESYFPAVAYATYQNLDLILHETNGIIYSLEADTYQDNGAPINVHLRLPNWDGGTQHNKVVNRGQLVADVVDSSVLVRYSDDDYQTFSTYRAQDLNALTSKLTRLQMTQMRGYEFRHTDNTEFRAETWEQEQTVENF